MSRSSGPPSDSLLEARARHPSVTEQAGVKEFLGPKSGANLSPGGSTSGGWFSDTIEQKQFHLPRNYLSQISSIISDNSILPPSIRLMIVFPCFIIASCMVSLSLKSFSPGIGIDSQYSYIHTFMSRCLR